MIDRMPMSTYMQCRSVWPAWNVSILPVPLGSCMPVSPIESVSSVSIDLDRSAWKGRAHSEPAVIKPTMEHARIIDYCM